MVGNNNNNSNKKRKNYKAPLIILTTLWGVVVLISISFFIVSLKSNNQLNSFKEVESTQNITIQSTEQQTTQEVIEETTEELIVEEILNFKVKSLLTGLYIDEDIADKRPFAVTINNLPKALPQSGISQADIYYEVLAEGGITRLVAIFQNADATKLGPVRSARDYFLDFALDNDAIYIHHGGSPQAYANLKDLRINNFDGMKEERFFFRDSERLKQKGMYEHSSYIDAIKFYNTLEQSGYRKENSGSSMFRFSDEPVILKSETQANKITLPFSNEQISVYEYDEENNIYNRFQNSQVHIDELTGEQLSVTNVIVQFTDIKVLPSDDAGRREVKLIGEGKGLYITGGKVVEIKWNKESHSSKTVWTDLDGNILKLNPGKTWINVFSKDTQIIIE